MLAHIVAKNLHMSKQWKIMKMRSIQGSNLTNVNIERKYSVQTRKLLPIGNHVLWSFLAPLYKTHLLLTSISYSDLRNLLNWFVELWFRTWIIDSVEEFTELLWSNFELQKFHYRTIYRTLIMEYGSLLIMIMEFFSDLIHVLLT